MQLLSGFVGTSGGFASLVLPLSKRLVNQDSLTDRVFPGEGISFVDRESLLWAKLVHPCRVLSFESHARGYVADGNLLMSGCRKPEVDLKLKYTKRVCNRDGLFSAGVWEVNTVLE